MHFITKVTLSLAVTSAVADASYIVDENTRITNPRPPHPFYYSYSAGRAPGHVDRTHTEVSDGSGTIRGSFSYVDPRYRVRTNQYVADEENAAEANRLGRERHFALYNRIAEAHQHPYTVQQQEPIQSAAVLRATKIHLDLYEKIANQHAQIYAQHAAQHYR